MRRGLQMMGALVIAGLLSACAAPWSSRPPATIPQPPSSSGPTQPSPAPSPASPAAPTPGSSSPTAPSTPVSAPPAAGGAWVDASSSPFAIRGIIEGFYGAPWTQEQRLAAFDFMAKVGMNTYVYAPKDDPYQRAQWRTLYPAAELDRFRTLLDRTGRNGINFVYSISPGLDITYSSATDRQALLAKVRQLRSLGIHTIMFSVDDVPEKLTPADAAAYQNNYALAQADLANWLYATEGGKDPSFRLWMTPSHYYGVKSDPYLVTLGKNLNAHIPLIWTGPDILSTTITAADTDTFAALIGRKPLIWDNYPVNDYTYVIKKKPRLIMGPIRGRDPNLASHVSGYLLNPMIQSQASQLPLFTAAEYLADPTVYDPQAAWLHAASHVANSPADAATLLEFASFAQISAVYDAEAPELAQAITDYWNGAGPATLQQKFTAMTTMPTRLANAVSPGFYAEVAPWAQALADKGRAGLLALEVDAAVRRSDSAAVRAKLPQLKSTLAAIQTQDASAYIAYNLVEDFLTKVIGRAQGL